MLDVAIVDLDLGNLFSVRQACEAVGLSAAITQEVKDVAEARAVVLPGVGAFGDAMNTMRTRQLDEPIRAAVEEGRPVVGICLGLQLFMERSVEFGTHEGLGLFGGDVVPLQARKAGDSGPAVKVPQVAWNKVRPSPEGPGWEGTLLDGVPPASYMYFTHSYRVRPTDPTETLAVTSYGDVEYASVVTQGNVFGCQFHPERSGDGGLAIYRNLARSLGGTRD